MLAYFITIFLKIGNKRKYYKMDAVAQMMHTNSLMEIYVQYEC